MKMWVQFNIMPRTVYPKYDKCRCGSRHHLLLGPKSKEWHRLVKNHVGREVGGDEVEGEVTGY